jgi:hypothetical protein
MKRKLSTLAGMISFQEHIWIIVKQSLNMARKKANASNTGIKFIMTQDVESEDLSYNLEWIRIMIRGTKEQEEEEYNDTMKLYNPLNNMLSKKEMPKDANLGKHFNSKILQSFKVEEAYKKGYGAMGQENVSNKLLELGILTHVEQIDDFDSREYEIPIN